MRNLSTTALTKIAERFGNEPITILDIAWRKNGSVLQYADRDVQSIPGKILEVSTLDSVITQQQSQSQSISVTLDDTDGTLKAILDRADIHQRDVWVYQTFEGLELADRFLLFRGQITSPVTYSEGDRTLSLTVLSQVEDQEIGFSAEEGDFASIAENLIGQPWPMNFGTVVYGQTLRLDQTQRGILANDMGTADFSLPDRFGLLFAIASTLRTLGNAHYLWRDQAQGDGDDAEAARHDQIGFGYHDQANQFQIRGDEVALGYQQQQDTEITTFRVFGGEEFPRGNVTLRIDDVLFSGAFQSDGDTFQVLSRTHPKDNDDFDRPHLFISSIIDFVNRTTSITATSTGENAQFFGTAWNQTSTDQRELFEDGGQFLPFVDVTDSDRSLNQVATDNSIEVADLPVWIFADDTRLEGVQSLQRIADASGIAIPTSTQPFLAPLPDDTLLVGSPLLVSLDGYDPSGGPLTYTVTTDNAGVTAEILTGNRSARIDVAGYGDMVFELFEQRATRATDRFIELAEDDFYRDILFHRVVNDFIIQGGDPDGTGTGGSTLGDFDDQFDVDLQHNRTGLLSYAKSTDDTNDSQFFITEGDSASLRNLDFNHTIFGVLSEGEAIREAISNTAVSGPASSPRPINDVVMEGIEIFQDNENATLLLKAADGTSGPVNVTVTVSDQNGKIFQRAFGVTVSDDTINGRPFLGDIAPVSVAINTLAEIQLTATDVEGDPVVFQAFQRGTVNYTFDVSDTGLLTVTPPTGFTGTLEIEARVRREVPTSSTDFDSQLITITVT